MCCSMAPFQTPIPTAWEFTEIYRLWVGFILVYDVFIHFQVYVK